LMHRVIEHTGDSLAALPESTSGLYPREVLVDLSKMRTPDWILGGCALVLIIDLLFLPWHKYDFDLGDLGPLLGGGSHSVKRTAIQSPDSFWGILALLLAIAVLAVVLIRRLSTAKLPELPISWTDATFYATIATLALLLLKLIIDTDNLGFGSYLGILLAAGAVYGAFATKQADQAAPTAPPTSF
jgi:hypothetical protein